MSVDLDKDSWWPCKPCQKVIEETGEYLNLCEICQHNSDIWWANNQEICDYESFLKDLIGGLSGAKKILEFMEAQAKLKQGG